MIIQEQSLNLTQKKKKNKASELMTLHHNPQATKTNLLKQNTSKDQDRAGAGYDQFSRPLLYTEFFTILSKLSPSKLKLSSYKSENDDTAKNKTSTRKLIIQGC